MKKQARNEKMKALALEGVPYEALAERFGITRGAVACALNAMGVRLGRRTSLSFGCPS